MSLQTDAAAASASKSEIAETNDRYLLKEKYSTISTELIPDEYSSGDNHDETVHIFYNEEHSKNLKTITSTYKEINYKSVSYKTKSLEEVRKKLELIAKEEIRGSSLIIIFLGDNDHDLGFIKIGNEYITIKEIWSHFLKEKFRNKPKIFMIHVTQNPKPGVQQDSFAKKARPEYVFPLEADLLMAYKVSEEIEEGEQFIKKLYSNIARKSKRDSLYDMFVNTECTRRPQMISTLTRSFYLQKSQERGAYLDMKLTHSAVTKKLQDIEKNLSQLPKLSADKKSPGGGTLKRKTEKEKKWL